MVKLTKIYTRTGDEGTTGLSDFSRTRKTDPRIEAYADVDEANSAIGVAVSLAHGEFDEETLQLLSQIQNDLFDLGGELCIPGMRLIEAQHTERLEEKLDAFNEPLPPLKDFILPGGGPAAAACHLARTIVRRAERRVWSLAALSPELSPEPARYLNRLSDLLFVIARVLARHENGAEVIWKRNRGAG